MGVRTVMMGDCCGAQMLYNFTFAYGNEGDEETVAKYLQNILNRPPTVAWIFAILNEAQEPRLGRVLRAHGFIRARRRMNPNTGNELFCYIHKPEQ